MFVYKRTAIDFWDGWFSENEYLDRADAHSAEFAYQLQKQLGFMGAKKLGWDGDVREGPFVAGLPTDKTAKDGHVVMAWKQDNNGDTYIVSPFKMPWLEGYDSGDDKNWVEFNTPST